MSRQPTRSSAGGTRPRTCPSRRTGKAAARAVNTTQRNLRALFVYLAEEYDHPNPYDDPKFHNYAAPQLGKPRTLSEEFIQDTLDITAWGPGRKDFETTRDHALLRVLTESLRAEEIRNIRVQDLDLQGAVLVVVPLKMDRNSVDGRVIPLQPSTVKALQRYLRLRTTHKRSSEPWLWLGLNNRPRLSYPGLRNMTKRVAERAGHDSAEVSPRCWCCSWADGLRARGVSGQHIMAIRGWKSPAMPRRYGADIASQRAVNTMHNLGDRYS